MSFMQRQISDGQWWVELDGTQGITFVPYDILSKAEIEFAERDTELPESDDEIYSQDAMNEMLGDYYEGSIQSVTVRQGFGARLSAPGYLDCTEWAVFDTAEEAEDYLKETYPEDEDDE